MTNIVDPKNGPIDRASRISATRPQKKKNKDNVLSLTDIKEAAKKKGFKINSEKIFIVTHPFFNVYSDDLTMVLGITYDRSEEHALKSPQEIITTLLSRSYQLKDNDPGKSRIFMKYAFETTKTMNYLKSLSKAKEPVILVLDQARTANGAIKYFNGLFANKNNVYYIYSQFGSGYFWKEDDKMLSRILPKGTKIELSGSLYNVCGQFTFDNLKSLGYEKIDYRKEASYKVTDLEKSDEFISLYKKAMGQFNPNAPLSLFTNELIEEFTRIAVKYY